MTRPVVFLTHSPEMLERYYGANALSALRAIADVRVTERTGPWTIEALATAAQDCDIIVSDRGTEAPAKLLDSLPRRYRAGETPAPAMGSELRGATLGIIGFGQIGRYLADLALAFGMRVLVCDPHARVLHPALRQVTLPQLLADADHVVCLARATPETENLMDAAAFAAMKPTAFFVNASRGNLVDDAALLQALDSGQVAGCALDVGRAPDQMPSPRLAQHPRVLATPHIGGLTPPAIAHQAMETARQVSEIAAGRVPVGAVNADAARRLRAPR